MSFNAKLKVKDKEYKVLDCSYELFQETDATGRPASVTRGGKITISVESTGDTNLSDWMFASHELRDGSIIYEKRDEQSTLKELTFKKAYMVQYQEKFDSSGEKPLLETFTISAETITMGNSEHTNEWPV